MQSKNEIIQEMIQIERPSGWNLEQINLISKDIKKIELYNKMKNSGGIRGWEMGKIND